MNVITPSSSRQVIFGEPIQCLWEHVPIIDENVFKYDCQSSQFYLNVPDIARFLALPAKNSIIVEKTDPSLDDNSINIWLFGTVMAYILQYHGYLVLHGSAVMINDEAVIFSGHSGAGKSTLASALVQKGHLLITDDLVVIKRNEKNQYCIIPGPQHIKLWRDSMRYFDYDQQNACPIHHKVEKFSIPISQFCNKQMIPIKAFYELNFLPEERFYVSKKSPSTAALKIIMQNSYRHFMLKPLGKLESFFYDCTALLNQISVYKILRTKNFDDLPEIVKSIELNSQNHYQ